MIKIENPKICGWESAIRGMRNPLNSWSKSDSGIVEFPSDGFCEIMEPWNFRVGPNDLKLMKTLANAGNDHGKYLRMITVYVDITAPIYWLKEADTYKVGTVSNSCSTMHKIQSKEFVPDDFSHDHLDGEYLELLNETCNLLNKARDKFNETKDKKYWWYMIQSLPSTYNQRRTLMLNYAVLKNMYHSRKNHKLDEWVEFCQWIETLPYSELITGKE